MSKTKQSEAERIAADLEEGGNVHENVGGNIGHELADILKNRGWKPAKSYSYCTKASSEWDLTNGKTKVNIVVASFMGTFTQVDAYSVVR